MSYRVPQDKCGGFPAPHQNVFAFGPHVPGPAPTNPVSFGAKPEIPIGFRNQ